jgi:drug/metabolite transporter (DMT)-like permease
MLTAAFVAARIVANPVSNVLQKQLAQRSANPVFIIAATHALLTVAALPFVAAARPMSLSAAFWTDMALCAALAVAGNALLIFALRSADLSIVGPINAYKAILGLAMGVAMLGEVPTVLGLAGVLLILAGSYGVVDRAPDQRRSHAFARFFRDRGVQLRLAALVFSATEAVFLKRAIRHATPEIAFLFWSILGLPVAAAAVAMLRRGSVGDEIARFRLHWRAYVALSFTTGLMQAATLLTFGRMHVGYALALFQLSSLIGVLLGRRYFKERSLGRRLAGAAVMTAGAMLIVAFGRSG